MPHKKLPPISQTIAQPRCCTFDELRQRAFIKADTGRYANWVEAAAAVEAEDCPGATDRLRIDPMLTRLIDARCQQAIDRNN